MGWTSRPTNPEGVYPLSDTLTRLYGYVYRDPPDPNGTRAAPTALSRGLSCLTGDLRMRRLLADWLATTGVFSSISMD